MTFERRGRGEPLVLLHGIGHHWQGWLPVMDLLIADHDVIALDFPGFGASPPLPPGTPYTADALADTVQAFCARHGIREPHVAGSSVGGYVALELAARGAVRTATALAPAGFWTPTELAYLRTTLRALRAAVLVLPPEQGEMFLRSPAARAVVGSVLVAHPMRLSPETLMAAGRALREATGFEELLDSLSWLMPPSPPKVPITIAWGDRDRLLPRRQAVRAARWSGQRVKLLRGCGHLPMSDDPELVARVIRETTAG